MTAARGSARPALGVLGPAAGAALLAACGGTAGDLMAVERSGPAARGATQRVVITGDGRGRCGPRAPLRPLRSPTVIEARSLERQLEPLAARAAAYQGPARGGRLRFVARTRAGTVRWVEGAPGRPPVLPRVELFTLRVARALCPRGPTGAGLTRSAAVVARAGRPAPARAP